MPPARRHSPYTTVRMTMPAADLVQTALSPAGPQAVAIHQLWSLMLWFSTVVLLVLIAFVFAALVRGRRRRTGPVPSPVIHCGAWPSRTRSLAAARSPMGDAADMA